MIQKVLVTPIIGLPQMNGWAQVTSSQDGSFIAAFSISGAQAGNVGRDLVDLISNAGPDSATAVYALMKKIVRFVEDKDCTIQIASSYFANGDTIFSAVHGALLLKRNGKIGCVLLAEDEIKLIEGKRLEADIFVLMSEAALGFREEIFQKLLQGLDADTTVASIVPGVQNLPNSSLVSMAFLTDLPAGYRDERPDPELDRPLVEIQTESQLERSAGADSSNPAALSQPLIEVMAATPVVKGASQSKFPLTQLKQWGAWGWRWLRVILNWLGRWLKKVVKLVIMTFSDKVYVDEKPRLPKKVLRVLIVGGGLAVLILLTVGVWRARAADQVKQAIRATTQVMSIYEESKDQVEANPIAARESLVQVVAQLEAQEKAFAGKPAGQKYIQNQLQQVRSFYDSISGKQVFTELNVFYDFQLVAADFIAHKVDSLDGSAYFLDKDRKKVVKLELASKKVQVSDLGSLNGINDAAVTADELLVLGQGIFAKKTAAEAEIARVVDEGKSNQGARLLSAFNHNLYVFNPEQRNIFKHTYDAETKKFSEPIRWIKSAKELDFQTVVSMVVDGNVWLTTKTGQIFRFSNGEGSPLEIKGLSEAFASPLFLYTQAETEFLYLLEPAKSRVVVLNKNGDFVKEVKSVSLAAGNGLVVDAAGKQVLVISGSLVFEVGL